VGEFDLSAVVIVLEDILFLYCFAVRPYQQAF